VSTVALLKWSSANDGVLTAPAVIPGAADAYASAQKGQADSAVTSPIRRGQCAEGMLSFKVAADPDRMTTTVEIEATRPDATGLTLDRRRQHWLMARCRRKALNPKGVAVARQGT